MAASPIYEIPLRRTYGFEALRGAFQLRQFLRQKKVRIVQTFFESADLWAGIVTSITSDAKLVWSRRDMGILRSTKHRMAYRLFSTMPDAVFAVSEKVRQHCIGEDRISEDHVYTIYNGVDIDRFRRTPSDPHRELLVTTVGNVRRVKGHDIFIRAAAAIAERVPVVRFSIAGEVLETDYYEELQKLIETLGLTDRFRFEGNVTDLPKFLANADVFVMPSRSEGFSNAIIEAMAASLPVVATSVGGNPEAVEDGVTGILVQPEDPVPLANAVIQLLSDPERSSAIGKAGRHLARQKFSVESVMDQVVGVYRRLLSSA
jgi:glycosyltransferase involved in cell wall biosynthesis